MRSRSARFVAYLLLLLSCLAVIAADARAALTRPALFRFAPRDKV